MARPKTHSSSASGLSDESSPAVAKAYLALSGVFLAWKLVLLLVVLATPAPASGYDTSSALFFELLEPSRPAHGPVAATKAGIGTLIATKLTRWDALYFVSTSWRGYVHEQDWAFASGYTLIFRGLSQVLRINSDGATNGALHGILTANLCHLLSVYAIYQLVLLLIPAPRNRQIAYITALLHVIAPAGVFLLAPYSESLFALLNIIAQYLYASAINKRSQDRCTAGNLGVVASGAVFGLATTVRSNGLLNGSIFALDALLSLYSILTKCESPAWATTKLIPSLWATILAGLLVGAGFIFPQWVAFQEYCFNQVASTAMPSWCLAMPPSIYTYVQSHYWSVGLFKYWRLSNVPLFLLAAPMLFVLALTGIITLRKSHVWQPASALHFSLFRLAIPQVLIALLTLTTAHVQIVNRLSTGYPVWYLCLAEAITSSDQKHQKWTKIAVQLMVTYAIVQAALFAAFLPPA